LKEHTKTNKNRCSEFMVSKPSWVDHKTKGLKQLSCPNSKVSPLDFELVYSVELRSASTPEKAWSVAVGKK
jgi:hypothetical protein